MKRGRKYHGLGEEYNVEKRERGSNIIFPLILRLFRRISSGEEGKGFGNYEEENKALKMNWGGEEYQVEGNFINPWTEY